MIDDKTRLDSLPYTALREAVVASIRAAILAGRLKPGQRVLEAELAEELGVSRAPVREAIRQLESEGLLVCKSHRGTHVARVSPQDAREIFSLRAALEGLAVLLVVQSGHPELFDQLEPWLEAMQASVDAGDMAGVIQADFQFHETLCRAAGHQRLLSIWLSMSVQIRALVSVNDLQYFKPQEIVSRHRALVEMMRALDAERAMRLLVKDILEAGEYTASSLATCPRGGIPCRPNAKK